jgi:hypothetical protein
MPPKRNPSTSTAAGTSASQINYDSDSSDDELHTFKIKLRELPMFSGNTAADISAKE